MTGIFISHSSKAGPQACAFIAELQREFDDRQVKYFLDQRDLLPGDVWQPRLHRELARCDGAVLVLDPAALTSDWVRKEATILAWRRALRLYAAGSDGAPMRVVVSLVDGVSRADVRNTYRALHLDDSEFSQLATPDPAEAHAEAARVAGLFPPTRSSIDPLQHWTAIVSGWLTSLTSASLDKLESILQVQNEFRDDLDGRCYSLADALLHRASLPQVVGALTHIGSVHALNSQDIVNRVLPVVVPSPTASVLLTAIQEEPGSRVAALNATRWVIAQLAVQRATCCSDLVEVVATSLTVSANAEAVYQQVVEAIGTQACADPPSSVTADDLLGIFSTFVVVLQRTSVDGDGGLPLRVLKPLLQRLRRDFPSCVFLVLTGPEYGEDGLVAKELRADPPLRQGDERIWMMNANRLRSLSRSA